MKLSLKDHLETSTEASKRVRSTTIVLVVITVLILTGVINTFHNHAWTRNRIKFRQEYGQQLQQEIARLKSLPTIPGGAPSSASPATEPGPVGESILEILPPSCGLNYCAYVFVDCGDSAECKSEHTRAKSGEDSPETRSTHKKLTDQCDTDQKCREKKLACYECSSKFSGHLLVNLEKSYVENIYLIRVPFFGVALDVNDLGLIGGLSLLIVLIMLRLSLRNYIISLRISIKNCFTSDEVDQTERENFYEILTARQLFVFPHFRDENQEYFTGETEKSWKASCLRKIYSLPLEGIVMISAVFLFFLRLIFHYVILFPSKENGEAVEKLCRSLDSIGGARNSENGYYVNPQLSLKIVPKIISIVPGIVYLLVVINDYLSYDIGRVVDEAKAYYSFIFSIVFLFMIWSIGFWCISKWFEVDGLWEGFYKKVFLIDAESTSNNVET